MAFKMTVRDALRLPALSGSIVVAGEKSLDNEIRTVIVGDTLDISDWIERNDFVISSTPFMRTGSNPPPSTQILCSWAKTVFECHPCALGIKTMNLAEEITNPRKRNSVTVRTSRYMSSLPKELIELGNQYGIPVIQLPAFAAQNEISRDIMWGIIQKYEDAYKKSVGAFMDLCSSMLDGDDGQKLAVRLAQHMGNPILIENDRFELIAASNLNGPGDEQDIDVLAMRRSAEGIAAVRDSLTRNPGTLVKLILKVGGRSVIQETMPVMADRKILGYITVFELNEPITAEKEDIFITCVTAIALEMRQKTYLEQNAIKERSRFLTSLLAPEMNEALCRNLAGIIGFEENTEKICMAIGVNRTETNHPKSNFSYYQNLIMRLTAEYISAGGMWQFTCDYNGCIILYLYAGKHSDEAVMALAERTQKYLESSLPNTDRICIGIGRRGRNFAGFRSSCFEAMEALQYIYDFDPNSGIAEYNKISHHLMLTSMLKNKDASENLCDSLLGKLIERDEKENSELLKTLETFLACNCSYVDTGKALFLHPKTIRYRVEQITQLVPMDLNDFGNRSTLWMSLKLLPHLRPDLYKEDKKK